MSVIAAIRDSKPFKAVADISVVHWIFTSVLGSASGIEAAVHGKPLETVLLYGVGVSALTLAALHYGALFWTKHFSTGIQVRSPGSLKRLIIPVLAAVVILAVWFLRPQSKPAIVSTFVPVSGAIGGSQSGQAASTPEAPAPILNHEISEAQTPKKGIKSKARGPLVNASQKQPVTRPTMSQECAPGASCGMSSGQTGGITAGTINLGPPPPQLRWSQEQLAMRSQTKNALPTVSMVSNDKLPTDTLANPGVVVKASIDRTATITGYRVKCDRPCQLVNVISDAIGGAFQALLTNEVDGDSTVVLAGATMPIPMPSGYQIELEIHSRDAQKVKVENVTLVMRP